MKDEANKRLTETLQQMRETSAMLAGIIDNSKESATVRARAQVAERKLREAITELSSMVKTDTRPVI